MKVVAYKRKTCFVVRLVVSIFVLSLILGGCGRLKRNEKNDKPPVNQVETKPPTKKYNYAHAETEKKLLGKGGDAVWVYTPKSPTPSVAPIIAFMHGYRGTEPYAYGGWIDHLVRNGNIVVFPIFEDSIRDSDSDNINAAINGIKSAISTLEKQGPVRPDTSKFALVGHSFGGGLSAVLAAKAGSVGLPIPKVIMLAQPGWKGGGEFPDNELASMPSSVMMLIVDGSEDQFADTREGKNIYQLTSQIPQSQKAYIILQSDSHNGSVLLADHYAPLSPREDYKAEVKERGASRKERRKERIKARMDIRDGEVDALDQDGFWLLFDVLLASGFSGEKSIDRVVKNAGGESMGKWPDGTSRKPRIMQAK